MSLAFLKRKRYCSVNTRKQNFICKRKERKQTNYIFRNSTERGWCVLGCAKKERLIQEHNTFSMSINTSPIRVFFNTVMAELGTCTITTTLL